MIRSTNGKITKDLIMKGGSKRFPERLNKRAILLLQPLSDVSSFKDLKNICEPPSLKIHKLKGNIKKFWSITIEKPWCIIFQYNKEEFINVEVMDYHD